MTNASTPGFRRLTIAAAIAVYILMVVGGIVRITGSGLGCPDWPLCHGKLLPPLELTAIIEYTHRSAALIGGLLVIAVASVAWRNYRHDVWIAAPALLVIVLLVVQIPLGALVVASELRPIMVAVHLGIAMLILGNSLAAAVGAHRPAHMSRHLIPLWYRSLLGSTMAAVFLLLITGALVVGTGSSEICRSWPLCGSATGETGLSLATANPAVAISMYHRYVVLAVSILVTATVIQTLRLPNPIPGMRRWAWLMGALFITQVAIGAVQVLLGMPTLWRILHLATATGVWSALVIITAMTVLGAFATERVPRTIPAVDSAAT